MQQKEDLKKEIHKILNEYQLSKGTIQATYDIVEILEEEKQERIEKLSDYYSE